MSGICSRHSPDVCDPDCPACNGAPRDLLPDWDKKHADAEAAGRFVCKKCGYQMYLTTRICSGCGEKTSEMPKDYGPLEKAVSQMMELAGDNDPYRDHVRQFTQWIIEAFDSESVADLIERKQRNKDV